MKENLISFLRHFSLLLVFILLVPAPSLLGKSVIAMIIAIVFNTCLLIEQKISSKIARQNSFILSCLCFIAILSIFLVIFLPGGMITDSHYLFSMAYTNVFHSYRSRFLALIYQLFFLIHRSTVPILIAQLLLYASAITLLVHHLLQKRLVATALLVFIMAFMPMFSGIVGVLCENAWISVSYMFGILVVYTAVQRSPVRSCLLVISWFFCTLAFFTRSYDVLYGLPLFFTLFFISLKQGNSRNVFLTSSVLTFLMLFGQVGATKLIDRIKGTIDENQHERFMNYYRALPVPLDQDIKLPPEIRSKIEEHLKSKGEGWRALNDLADYSILVEGKMLAKGEVVSEIAEYIQNKPFLFLRAYLARAVYLLVIPYTSNWVTSTMFHPESKLNKLNFQETSSLLERKYVHYANSHRKYALIYQPIAILALSMTALLLATLHLSRASFKSLVLLGWAGSGCVQVLVNLLLAYHGAYRLYHWSVLSSVLVIVLLQAKQGIVVPQSAGISHDT